MADEGASNPTADPDVRDWELRTFRDLGIEPIFVQKPGMVILATGRAGSNPDPSLTHMHATWKSLKVEPLFLNNEEGDAPCVVLFSAKLRGFKLSEAMLKVSKGLRAESKRVRAEAEKARAGGDDDDDDDDDDDGASLGPR